MRVTSCLFAINKLSARRSAPKAKSKFSGVGSIWKGAAAKWVHGDMNEGLNLDTIFKHIRKSNEANRGCKEGVAA